MRRTLLALTVGLLLGAGTTGAEAAPPNILALLAVPKAQLGNLADGLQVELKSGTTDNARAASDSFDPNATEVSIKRAGRLIGYTLLYGDVGWTALRTGHGMIDIGTSIDLFKTEAQARLYSAKSLRDVRAAQGKNLQGTVIERVQLFRINGLGPGAVGIHIVQRLGTHRIHSTFVDFQIANFLCEAAIDRADGLDVRRQAAAIAQRLRDRFYAYGQKKLHAKPATLPRPLGTAKPGAGAPDLSAMVPTRGDLNGKAGVLNQGFLPDQDAIGSYAREFSFGPSSKTGLLTMHAQAALERSAREASGRLFVLRSVFTGPEAADTLAHLLARGATVIHLEGTQSAKVGDESFATAVTFNSQGRHLRAMMIWERRDRVLGSIVMIGTAKGPRLAGALAYARVMDKHIKAALNPALVA